MLFPMMAGGGMGMDDFNIVPDVVKEKHHKLWMGLLFLMLGVVVLEIISKDIFAAVFTGIMSLIVWYMSANKCASMNSYCVLMYGFMCVIEAVFEIINLCMMLHGRTEVSTTRQVTTLGDGSKGSASAQQITYTSISETHPFFDGSQGIVYNIQSASTIISPIVMLLGGLLSYFTYKAFSHMAQDLEAEQANAPLRGGGGFGGFGGGFGGYGAQGPPPQNPQPQEPGPGTRIQGGQIQRPAQQPVLGRPAAPRLFEGSGHRLGDG